MNIEKLYKIFGQSTGVCTDTRKMEKGKLFFALSGENFNGNRFAAEALKKGALAAVVDDPAFVPAGDSRYLLAENTLDALQTLASYHRKQFDIPVLAITGTNGKTTTKELVAAVLSTQKNICATQGNLNNHIGVPLTLLSITKETEMAVVEMGANHPGEIAALCNITRPTYGLITNIGKAHLEGFGSFRGVVNTKNELYRAVKENGGTVFVNKDNPLLMQLSESLSRVTYGTPPANVAGRPEKGGFFLSVLWHQPTGEHKVKTQLYGSYNFSNVMAALAVGSHFGIPATDIQQAIARYEPRNNRSQRLETGNNVLILDAYNANPESMRLAIDDFADRHFPQPVLILGDMFELGKAAAEEHQKIVDKLEDTGFETVILAGKEFYKTRTTRPYTKTKTTEELIRFLKTYPIKNSHILIKGSRGMQLEKIVEYL